MPRSKKMNPQQPGRGVRPRRADCVRQMDQIDIAWLAGIIEGEGCIGFYDAGPRITVNMTDRDIIERCYDITGEGNVNFRPRANLNWKPTWTWVVGDHRGIARLLLAIYPLLGERRHEKVAEVVKKLQTVRYSPCGTEASFAQHRRRAESPCESCRIAKNAAVRRRYHQRKQNAAAP